MQVKRTRIRNGLLRVVVVLIGLAAGVALASEPRPAVQASASTAADERLPGVELATGISQLTGVAISPLLGVSAVGAWHYFRTEPSARAALPWHCHPWVWGLGFAILALCLLKDTVGTATPALLKKPLDMAELFEDKASALLAAGILVPATAAQMAAYVRSVGEARGTLPFAPQYASLLPFELPAPDLQWVFIPLALFAFAVVWLTAHAINVLIAFSPFTLLDAGLKLSKAGLILLVTVPFLIHPMFGAAVSLLVIAIAAWLAPAAFRLTRYGSLMSLDILWPWRKDAASTPANAHAFTARRIDGVPVRTYGRLRRAPDEAPIFSYRPWLVLPRRSLRLPADGLAIGRGLLFPSLLHRTDPSRESSQRLLSFRPRYRGREEALAAHCRTQDIRDSALLGGARAIKAWMREVFGSSRATGTS